MASPANSGPEPGNRPLPTSVSTMEDPAEATGKPARDGGQLIPGLPDEVAEYCLLRLPFPYLSAARSVSSSWKLAVSAPAFLQAREALSLSLPYLFVFAFHRSTFHLRWRAFDPSTRRWFPLPPMPLPDAPAPVCPPAFACAASPRRGELFVLGGLRSDTQAPLRTLLTYRAATNSWSPAAPMPTPRAFLAAGCVGGEVFALGGYAAAGGDGDAVGTVERYDPEADRWSPAAGMVRGMSRYDAAAVGGRLYVTEGWRWPFRCSPRGGVYDPAADAWGEMPVGMREGWAGASAVVGGRLFVVSELGDFEVKVYEEGGDSWRRVAGGGLPGGMRKPFAVAGLEGRIYVVASGLDVAVGSLSHAGAGGEWRVDWEVVKGETALGHWAPCNSQVLYA